MPIIKSAKKRVRTAEKASIRNAKTKRSLKNAIKLFSKKTDGKNHSATQSNIDKAVKKGIIHKNKAARLKKQLAAKSKAAGIKPTAAPKKPAAQPKPPAKKATPAKKTPAKTPAAKKTPVKKAAPKKK